MEYRRLFDTIPELFDQYRPRYSAELFHELIKYAQIGPGKHVLELGPGTGQATDPILKTGCDYNAIELGEHLYRKMEEKYGSFPNFSIVNDDFITHDFKNQKFDLIYSAATIQWIPEKIAFEKTFELLVPGGTLAMMLTNGDYKTPNEALYNEIQRGYDAYYKPVVPYSEMHEPFDYRHAVNYGFVCFEKREFHGKRVFNADQYVAYCHTHSDHMAIPEPDQSRLFETLHQAVKNAGDRIVFNDTYVLYLARKPL